MRPAKASPGFFCWPALASQQRLTIYFNSPVTIPNWIVFQYSFMAKKTAVGRPAIAESEKRKGRFLVLLNDAEYATIRQAAGTAKVSTWAREVMLRAAKRR